MQKPFKGRPEAPIFIPTNSNGSSNVPQTIPPVFSIPTRGKGGSVRISFPSASIDVAFKPLIIETDETSLIEFNEPNGINRQRANIISSSVQSSKDARDLSGPINKSRNENKPVVEENYGRLIPVSKSELNIHQGQTSVAENLASADVFFGPLKENSKPPHRRALENSNPVASTRYVVPTNVDVDSEAITLHGLNLVVIKAFARRAEALRQGDPNAIPSTGREEGEEYEKSLPPVSYETRALDNPVTILHVNFGDVRHG